jgi:hypothetical protein
MNNQKKRRLSIVHTEASNGLGGQDLRVLHEALWFHDQGHRIHIFNPRQGQIFKRARPRGENLSPLDAMKNPLKSLFFQLLASSRPALDR